MSESSLVLLGVSLNVTTEGHVSSRSVGDFVKLMLTQWKGLSLMRRLDSSFILTFYSLYHIWITY